MWKWIYGYFDLFNFSDKINAKSEDLTEAIQAFKLASKFSNSKYAYEAISVLYYFSSLIYKDSLNEAIQNVAKAHSMFTFHSELILIIYGLLLLKNKDPECLNILKGLSPYAEIANYKIHRDINSIGIISTSTDSYCQYLYNKQNGSLFSLLNNQYLP